MYYVYIIYSAKVDTYYVGYTQDIQKRLAEHNAGISAFTAKANDWELKYSKPYSSRLQAHQAELFIKKKKNRKYIEWLIDQG
jgi:putative endonuclease